MKLISTFVGVTFLSLSLAPSVLAAPSPETIKAVLEAQPACGNFVRFDEKNLYLGFGAYRRALEEPRSPIPAHFSMAPLDGSSAITLSTKDSAIDIVTEGDAAFLLTYSSIEEWNLTKQERVAAYPTYAINGPLKYMEHANAFARYKNKLILAHGRLGVSFFDMTSKRLTNQFRLLPAQLPLESMATGVTVQGNLAYVLMDNFHLTRPGDGSNIFRGIIVIDMDKETVVAELGGMDPGADSISSDAKKLIVSFGGIPIWKYRLDSLKNGNSLPTPENRIARFPFPGHPIGAAAMDEKNYYTCFSKAPTFPGENGGRHWRLPLAFDRKNSLLD